MQSLAGFNSIISVSKSHLHYSPHINKDQMYWSKKKSIGILPILFRYITINNFNHLFLHITVFFKFTNVFNLIKLRLSVFFNHSNYITSLADTVSDEIYRYHFRFVIRKTD